MRHTVLLMLALMAPALAHADAPMFPVPAGATQVAHSVLQPGAAEEDHFWLKETYPASSAVDHYNKIFHDWRACTGKQKKWTAYGDVYKGKERSIHQLSQHWINAANDASITLVLEYVSAGIKPKTNPDNDRQYVALIRYTGKGASKEFSEMGLTCQKSK